MTPPYPPGYWVHEFHVENAQNPDDLRWFAAILLQRSDDERKLQVYSIPYRAVP